MRTRALGRSGLQVSEIGFGCWGIGGFVAKASYGETDDKTSLAALARALDQGITFFDTANSYGNGHSEELLGQAFGKKPDQTIIATKAGQPVFGEPLNFEPDHLRQSVEDSLRRLKREQIDLLQLHTPPLDLLRQRPEILGTLEDMRRRGKIRAVGLSPKSPAEAVAVIREFAVPVVQVNFNLVDHRALETGLLDVAAETGTGVIVRTPLAFGFLSGKLGADARFPDGDHRANWPADQIERWASAGRAFVGSIAARERQTLSQIALRFCLSYPGVTTAIPGMMRPEEVDENAAASDAGPLTPGDLSAIRATYAESAFAAVRPQTPPTPRPQ